MLVTKQDIIDKNTTEARLWLFNDEALYLLSLKVIHAKQLKGMWRIHAKKGLIQTRYVDWLALFDEIQDHKKTL